MGPAETPVGAPKRTRNRPQRIDGRTLAAGRQVVGSYRLTPNSDWTPTDCFGAPAVCESGNPEPVYE